MSMDLRECDNLACKKCGDRKERGRYTENGICTAALSTLDGRGVRCVGDWGQEKAYYLLQYLGIFAKGMRNRWQGLNYVEICSGPGRSLSYKSGIEHDGSALAVLRHPTYSHITSSLFLDYNEQAIDLLRDRIALLGIENARAIPLDYLDTVGLAKALSSMPENHLNLIFIDPTDLSFPFDAVRAISKVLPNADLLMTVAIGTDFNRNAERATMLESSKVRAKYEAFLGKTGFFDHLRSPDGRPAIAMTVNELRRAFTHVFREQLAGLGYSHTGEMSIKHYYDLVFASRHPRGLEFWDKACKIEYDGQRVLPYGVD